jgi:hypothetical protein
LLVVGLVLGEDDSDVGVEPRRAGSLLQTLSGGKSAATRSSLQSTMS